jgi:hypothetical protein
MLSFLSGSRRPAARSRPASPAMNEPGRWMWWEAAGKWGFPSSFAHLPETLFHRHHLTTLFAQKKSRCRSSISFAQRHCFRLPQAEHRRTSK